MADSSVLLEVVVEGKNIKIVQRQVEELAGSVNKASNANKKAKESTEKLTESRNRYSRGEKGVAQISANSTKNFSKMRDAMGSGSSGLVGAYATLAANVFAVTAAFGVLSRAAALTQLEQGLISVGSAAGANLPGVASRLKEITGAAISTEQAMRATAVAVSAGFSTTQLEKLTQVAKGASLALGRDMGDALDRLVRGTAKLEPEILDELGIIVRLDDATQEYAASIGKTANQLTQFERQQAFLNATIDQGLKKFDSIAKTIDPNAYDQLASSFNDLSKSILQVINVGITPLIQFLSQNSFALTGALLLFGTTLVRQIVPAISQVAAEQAKFAKQASSDSRRAAKVVSREYTTAIAKVSDAFKTVPQSVQALESKIKSGTASTRELEIAVRNLKKSEDLRFTALKTKGLQANAQKIQEYNETKALRIETERLLQVESRRMVSGSSGIRSAGVGTGAGLTARGLREMENATGIMGKFRIAARYSALELQNVGKTFTKTSKNVGKGAAVFNGARVALTALGGATRLFGSALLNLIPVLGQVFFVFSLVQPLIQPLIDKFFASDKAVKEATKGFSSFTEISKNLATAINGTNDSFEKFFATLKVRSGVLQQVSSALETLQRKAFEGATEKVDENAEAIVVLTQKLASLNKLQETSIKNTGQAYAPFTEQIRATKEEIEALRSSSAQLLKDSENADPLQGIKVIESAIAQIKSSGLGNALEGDIKGLEALAAEAATGTKVTFEQIINAVKEALNPVQTLEKSIEAIPEGFANIRKESAKLAQKGKTEFDALTASIVAQSTEIAKVFESGVPSAIRSVTENKDVKQLGKNLISAFGSNLPGVIQFEGAAPYVANYNRLIEAGGKKLQENNDIILTSAKNAAKLTAEAKMLAEASKNNVTIASQRFDLEQQALSEKLKGLRATEQNILGTLGEKEGAERLLAVRAEIASVTAQQGGEEEKNLVIAKARDAQERRILSINNKITAAKEAQAKAEQDQLKLQAQIAKAQAVAGGTLNVQDELNLLKDAQDQAKTFEDEKLKLKLEGIGLEYDLLNAQIAFERAKLKGLLETKQISAEAFAEGSLALSQLSVANGELFLSSTSAAEAQTKATKANIDAAIVLKQLEVAEKLRTIALESQVQSAERYSQLGFIALANLEKEKIARQEEARLKKEIADLESNKEKNGLAIAEKRLELAKLLTDEEIRRLDILKSAGEKLGPVSATAAAAVGSGQRVAKANETYTEISESPTATEADKAAAFRDLLSTVGGEVSSITAGIAEDMKKIGPEGELMSAVMSATSTFASTFVAAFEVIGDSSASMADKVQAGLAVAASVLQGFQQISKAATDAKVRDVDQAIAQEQKRDGKSKESLAKIAALEKKKENIQRKAFEQEKKMKIAQTIIATAQGAIAAYTSMAALGPVGVAIGAALAAAIVAMGAKQIAMIQSTTFQGGGSGSADAGPSSISIGGRQSSVDLAKSQSASGELAYMRGESGTGGPENFTPAFMGAKYRATGGPTTGYVVGEQGPELFVPEVPGNIVPNSQIQQAPSTNVNFTITALDASGVEDILVQQRGNLIGMMREAANSYGQPFLEGVDTASYTQTAGGVTKY